MESYSSLTVALNPGDSDHGKALGAEAQDEGKGLVVISDEDMKSDWIWSLAFKELRMQYALALPMIISGFLSYGLFMVTIMFVGHLGELELASASLATSFAFATGFCEAIGLSGAMETLCGQAYGAKKYHLMGLYLQASVITITICITPVIIVWFNMEKLLVWAGQDPDISRMAGSYLIYLIPALFSGCFSHPLTRYLQTQSVVLPIMTSSVVAMIFHPFLCYFCIYTLGLGYHGGALALVISFWISISILLLHVYFGTDVPGRTWNGFTWKAFALVPTYFRLAIPSFAMTCIEFWSFEILVFVSGFLPNPQLELSLLAICLNTENLMFMFPYGLSVAAGTRVSNELGARHPNAAKFSLKVAMGVATLQALTLSTILFLARNLWGHAFSNEEDVRSMMGDVLVPILALSCFMDGIQGILAGVIRGIGRQDLGAFINLGSFYLIGLPMAILLGFKFHLNSKGLWLGVTCGLFMQMVLLLSAVLQTDWKKTVDIAQERLRGPKEPLLPIIGSEDQEDPR